MHLNQVFCKSNVKEQQVLSLLMLGSLYRYPPLSTAVARAFWHIMFMKYMEGLLELLLDFVFIHKGKSCAVLTELGAPGLSILASVPREEALLFEPSVLLSAQTSTIQKH